MRTGRGHRADRVFLARALLSAAVALLCGCASDEPPAPPPDPLAMQPVTGLGPGMEVRSWTIRDDQPGLGSILGANLDRPVRMDPAMQQTWSQCGLRLIALPESELGRVAAALRPTAEFDSGPAVASVTTLWIGQGPRFSEAVRGTSSSRPRTIAMHDSRAEAPAGALRLIARCWPVADLAAPGDGEPPAALAVELIPQVLEPRRMGDLMDARGSATPTIPAEQGLLFTRLRASILLAPGEALMIIPESPQRDWRATPPDRPESPSAELEPEVGRLSPNRADRPAGPEAAGPVAGPPTAKVGSLGQQMLIYGGEEPGSRRLRTVLALVPRLPAAPAVSTAPAAPAGAPRPAGPSAP